MVKYWTFYILSDIFIKAKFLYCFLSLKNCVFAFPKKSISLSFDGSSQKGFSLLNPLLLLLLLWEFPQEKKNNVLRPLFAFAKGLSCSLEYSNCQKINLSHMCCLCFQDFFLDQNRKKKNTFTSIKSAADLWVFSKVQCAQNLLPTPHVEVLLGRLIYQQFALKYKRIVSTISILWRFSNEKLNKVCGNWFPKEVSKIVLKIVRICQTFVFRGVPSSYPDTFFFVNEALL